MDKAIASYDTANQYVVEHHPAVVGGAFSTWMPDQSRQERVPKDAIRVFACGAAVCLSIISPCSELVSGYSVEQKIVNLLYSVPPRTISETTDINMPTTRILAVRAPEDSGGIMNNIEKLNSLGALRYNWNGNGANPFSETLISMVKSIVTALAVQPDIFPTARNSIQLEYEDITGEYLELEVFEDRIMTLYIDTDGNESEEQIPNDSDQIKRVVSKFNGQQYHA